MTKKRGRPPEANPSTPPSSSGKDPSVTRDNKERNTIPFDLLDCEGIETYALDELDDQQTKALIMNIERLREKLKGKKPDDVHANPTNDNAGDVHAKPTNESAVDNDTVHEPKTIERRASGIQKENAVVVEDSDDQWQTEFDSTLHSRSECGDTGGVVVTMAMNGGYGDDGNVEMDGGG
ncbi:hypothetical protein RIF29_19021 [Crotalaria pallida]|uniref:Uncharacterized protein n=1 Tax=Crotalaria pallida TaxID=3830 RepID=A0AAN9I551_CROPI